MSTNELNAKVKELKELKTMAKELEAEITAIEDSIKAVMTEQGAEELFIDEYKLSYKPVTSNRFDTKSFKAKYAELYTAFTKAVTYKRFTIA